MQKGMVNEAIAEFEKSINLRGVIPESVGQLGYVYGGLGRKGEANRLIEQLKDLSTRGYLTTYNIAVIYTGLGENDSALEWLERAYKERASTIIFLKVNPEFDSLRSDPRFTDLLLRIGLVI